MPIEIAKGLDPAAVDVTVKVLRTGTVIMERK